MCRLQWASGAMGAAQVSGVRPGASWELRRCAGVRPGRGLRDRPGQRPREPDARQCFSVSLPPQAGAGQPAGAGAGCPFVHLSGSAAPSLRELSRYSSGFSTPALVPTETCACGVLSQSVVILCICLLGSLIWGRGSVTGPATSLPWEI